MSSLLAHLLMHTSLLPRVRTSVSGQAPPGYEKVVPPGRQGAKGRKRASRSKDLAVGSDSIPEEAEDEENGGYTESGSGYEQEDGWSGDEDGWFGSGSRD